MARKISASSVVVASFILSFNSFSAEVQREVSPGCFTETKKGKTLDVYHKEMGKTVGKEEMLADIVNARSSKSISIYGESKEHIVERFERDQEAYESEVLEQCRSKANSVTNCVIEANTLNKSGEVVYELVKDLSIFKNDDKFSETISDSETKDDREAAYEEYKAMTGIDPDRSTRRAINAQVARTYEETCLERIEEEATKAMELKCNSALGIVDEDGVSCEIASIVPSKAEVSGMKNDQFTCEYKDGMVIAVKPEMWTKGQDVKVYARNIVTAESLAVSGTKDYQGDEFKLVRNKRRACPEADQKTLFNIGRSEGHQEILKKFEAVRFIPEANYESMRAETMQQAVANAKARRDLEISQTMTACKQLAPSGDCSLWNYSRGEINCEASEAGVYSCSAPEIELRPM